MLYCLYMLEVHPLVGFVAVSIVIFLYSVVLYARIFQFAKDERLKPLWAFLGLLIIGFLAGYVFFGVSLLTHATATNIDVVVTGIFLMGSVFVAFTAQLFYFITKNLDGLVKDRTKKLQVEHRKAMKHERSLKKLQDDFLFIAAHELRTPVTAINWSAETLLESVKGTKKCTRAEKDMLEEMSVRGGQLAKLVTDLLETSRMESGTFRVNEEVVDIAKLVRRTDKVIALQLKERGNTLKVNIEKGLPRVKTDPRRVEEILINLLTNAIKYGKTDGTITVDVSRDKSDVLISVTDQGVGFTKAEAKKLFKRFSRIENSRTKNIKGTGLGLFIVEKIATRLGGSVSAKSPGSGKGSTFTLQLPIR